MTPSADTLVALGSAAVLAAGLFAERGGSAGLAVGAVAVVGLLARWRPTPPLLLLLTAYLCLFPDGRPVEPVGRGVSAGVRVGELLIAAAVVAYTAAFYRTLTARVEGADDADPVWPTVAAAATAAVGGWAALVVVARYQPDYARPLRFVRVNEFVATPLEQIVGRFVMLAGLLGALVGGAAGGLWLLRLNRLTPAEARVLLVDTRWRETRSELARAEAWRFGEAKPDRRGGCGWCGPAVLAFAGTFGLVLYYLTRG
jgi:hypothetical protein